MRNDQDEYVLSVPFRPSGCPGQRSYQAGQLQLVPDTSPPLPCTAVYWQSPEHPADQVENRSTTG